jgi:hypothetical protein
VDYKPGPDIENEARLEWHKDPFRYPYLRETWVMKPSRTRPVAAGAFGPGKRVIGYAVLRAGAPPSSRSFWGRTFWHRRVWWLYEDDAGMPRDKGVYGPSTGSYPVEAVSPFAVKAGRPSVFLNRREPPADSRLARLVAWLKGRGGRADLREILRAGVAGAGTAREALALAGALAGAGWCRLTEERRGKTCQKVWIVELIHVAGEEDREGVGTEGPDGPAGPCGT